jgi:hypothetical protein
MRDMPKGWVYEAPDRTVGSFTGYWLHDDCPVPPIDNGWYDTPPEVEEFEVWAYYKGEGYGRGIVSVWRLVCGCGAEATVTDEDWCPTDESLQQQEVDIARMIAEQNKLCVCGGGGPDHYAADCRLDWRHERTKSLKMREFKVTGVDTRGRRFRAIRTTNIRHALAINLFRGTVWEMINGKWRILVRVWN